MFRDDKSFKYDSKLLSFYVDIVGEQPTSSKFDTCEVDLATMQLDECSGACVRLALSGGALDGACLSLKILPKLRGASGSGGGRTGAGDASDASDASVMSQRGCGAGSDADAVAADTPGAEDPGAHVPDGADADGEALAQHQDNLALGQLKLATARRKAAAVKYAAGDGASGDDHEARAAQHEVQAPTPTLTKPFSVRNLWHADDGFAPPAVGGSSQEWRCRGRGLSQRGCEPRGREGSVWRQDATGVRCNTICVTRFRFSFYSFTGGGAVSAEEADPHNKFKGRFVTDKCGAIVRVEEDSCRREESPVAADYAIGAAAAGVVLASNSMADDVPPDVAGNENSTSGI